MFQVASRLGRSRLSSAFAGRKSPLPMRLFLVPDTGGVILEYGADLPVTGDVFMAQGPRTVTLSVEPPTFVADAFSPYPSIIMEVA